MNQNCLQQVSGCAHVVTQRHACWVTVSVKVCGLVRCFSLSPALRAVAEAVMGGLWCKTDSFGGQNDTLSPLHESKKQSPGVGVVHSGIETVGSE